MKGVISCRLIGVLALIIASMAFLAPTSVEACVTTKGHWKIHQDTLDAATDLHFIIYEPWDWIQGADISTKIVQPCPLGDDFDPPDTTHTDNNQGDYKWHAVVCSCYNGSVPKCCEVEINAKLELDKWNTVRIKDIVWTKQDTATDSDVPDNGWHACAGPESFPLGSFMYFNDDDEKDFEIFDLKFDRQGTGLLSDSAMWAKTEWDYLDLQDSSWTIPAGGSIWFYVPGYEVGTWLYFSATIHTVGCKCTLDVRGQTQSKWATYVGLSSFEAIGHDGCVKVEWTTATEIDNAGFNLYRSLTKDGEKSQLNDALIPAQGNELQGATYSFVDSSITNDVTYYYWLEDVDLRGNSAMHGPVSATPTSVEEKEEAPIPTVFSLAQNYPNPFNATTLIRYAIPDRDRERRPHRSTLKIYNIAGQEVKTLVDEEQAPGYYSVSWDGRDGLGKEVSSGIYFYRLQAGSDTEIKKMVLLK